MNKRAKKSTKHLFYTTFALVSLFLPRLASAQGMLASLLDSTIGAAAAGLLDLIFSIVTWITAQIGFLLDYVVEKMVLDMAELVNEITAIDALWEIFRDLGNIAFIGVLLYIAIRTILNVGNDFNTKRIMVRLIIVALFVNFSLFATKVVIDSSNVVALQFYNSIQVEDCGEAECNISHFFADATNISSVQSMSTIEGYEAIEEASNPYLRIAIGRTLGIAFLLVTAFVMLAISFLLIVRFGFLVLLMVASPLAFIAFILPNSKLGEQWWENLLGQSFFAPVLFAMLYVVAFLASGLQNGIAGEGNTDLMAAILSPDGGENFGVILVFILMIVLMMATLVVAKQMGGAASQGAIKIGKQARNWGQAKIAGAAAATGRRTVGWGGEMVARSDKLKDSAKEGSKFSMLALKLGNKASESSFDARNTKIGKMAGADDGKQRSGGFREVLEEKQEKRNKEREMLEYLSPAEKAKVERAKITKEKIDKNEEKAKKRLKKEKEEAQTAYQDQKDEIQAQYDRVKNSIQESEQETKSNLSDVSDDLKQVSSAIKQRDELGDKLAQARSAGDRRMVERITARIGALTDNISGVSDVSQLDQKEADLKTGKDNLQQRQKDLQNRRNIAQNSYNQQKEQVRDTYTAKRDALRDEEKQVRDLAKSRKETVDKIINVGKKRGEKFAETMINQQSILDKLTGGIIPGGTMQTQANRNFGIDNVSKIESKDEDADGKTATDRASRKLRDSYNS